MSPITPSKNLAPIMMETKKLSFPQKNVSVYRKFSYYIYHLWYILRTQNCSGITGSKFYCHGFTTQTNKNNNPISCWTELAGSSMSKAIACRQGNGELGVYRAQLRGQGDVCSWRQDMICGVYMRMENQCPI